MESPIHYITEICFIDVRSVFLSQFYNQFAAIKLYKYFMFLLKYKAQSIALAFMYYY